MKKILKNPFFNYSVGTIFLFIVLLIFYPWWISLVNSLALVIVMFLLDIAAKKINRNRNRYFPSWLTSLIWFFGIVILDFSHFPLIGVWILLFAGFIMSIIFPEEPKS